MNEFSYVIGIAVAGVVDPGPMSRANPGVSDPGYILTNRILTTDHFSSLCFLCYLLFKS